MTLSMVGCQQNDVSTGQEQTSAVSNNTIIPKVEEEKTEAETTTAPQNAEINIETLAEGEERDYDIEDILKTNLKLTVSLFQFRVRLMSCLRRWVMITALIN